MAIRTWQESTGKVYRVVAADGEELWDDSGVRILRDGARPMVERQVGDDWRVVTNLQELWNIIARQLWIIQEGR